MTDTTAVDRALAGTDVLTNSAEQCFMACHRKFYWAYEIGWRPVKTKTPLRIGAAIHDVLDRLAKDQPWDYIMEALDNCYAGHAIEAADWSDPQQGLYDLSMEQVTVECLSTGYATAWANSRIEILDSEAQFDLPIVNPATGRASRTFRQAGMRDRYCRLPDGREALLETKSVGQSLDGDSDYRRVLALNQQVSKYILAARAEGLNPATCLYDCIRKPTIKPTPVPRKDEHGLKIVMDPDGRRALTKQYKPRQVADKTLGQVLQVDPMTPAQWRHKLADDIASRPEYYYARFEVPRLQTDLEEYRHELWWIAESIRHCRNSGHWFRNTSACRNYNSLCPYYPLCANEVDTTNGVPAGFRQAENVHEELIEPEEEGGL